MFVRNKSVYIIQVPASGPKPLTNKRFKMWRKQRPGDCSRFKWCLGMRWKSGWQGKDITQPPHLISRQSIVSSWLRCRHWESSTVFVVFSLVVKAGPILVVTRTPSIFSFYSIIMPSATRSHINALPKQSAGALSHTYRLASFSKLERFNPI